MKRREIQAADHTEDQPLPSETPRDDTEHHRPPARVLNPTKTKHQED